MKWIELIKDKHSSFANKRVSSTYYIWNLILPDVINGSTITLSNSVIMMLARTGPSDEPIKTPSFYLQIIPLKENAVLVQQSLSASLKCSFEAFCWLAFLYKFVPV